MPLAVEAISENGVLRPTGPLPLQEHEKVHITIEPSANWVQQTSGILDWKGTPEVLQRLAEDLEFDYPPPPEEP
jgi:predicted DNA-binding antitoxin AbrB/MazE fold protein